MTVMAILQDVDKCMRCNGCVTACKREWNMKLPTDIAEVKPQRFMVGKRQRMAIKSLKRGDMGPFTRYSCWHCPNPPCAYACPFGAIRKEATGAISVDNTKCSPNLCKTGPGPKPCELGCQQGGYPKVGLVYESGPYATTPKMNKCTLCHGRAGADGVVDPNTALPTRARKDGSGNWVSDIPLHDPLTGTPIAPPVPIVPELAHEPACVSSCPAKAMKWDAKANIMAYLQDPLNGYKIGTSQNWVGNGAVFWASKKIKLVPPKADPFIEDHVTPMASSMVSSGSLVVPTILFGGLALLSARRAKVESEATSSISGEV